MEANYIILSFILVPFLGFILSVLIPERKEMLMSRVAIYTAGWQFFSILIFSFYWIFWQLPDLNINEVSLFQNKEYNFFIDFYFDKTTAVYLITGSFVTFLITRYSRYYMHLESGYKRFFNTILFFYLGYNWTVLSGNFETLFIGWEILGISSFLLIAFYRERYLPVRNAVKVFSIYRIGDVGILLAMWASHHLWHENITFAKLNNSELVHHQLEGHSGIGIFIAICILIAAAAKSAQIPFSSWLPRAMEGPTPSSAIFYGSLSVHFGVFLLIRTFPFWEEQIIVRVLIAMVGLTTAIIAFQIARVQSTIKSQIAYASITQIGIMFIEIAMGWEIIVLIHFAGNAFLRTFQLLISPSVVSYMIRDQFYHHKPTERFKIKLLPVKWKNTFYLLSLKEWHLNIIMYRYVFNPMKRLGSIFDFLTPKNVFYFIVPFYIIGIVLYQFRRDLSNSLLEFLPELFALIGLLLVMKAFSERKYPRLSWILVFANHFWVALAVSFNENYDYSENIIYLSGILVAGISGFICLQLLRKKELKYRYLDQYNGHVKEYPTLSFCFLISALALMGFPITPSFIGEDLIFSHIHQDQFLLGLFNSISFVLGGIALIRIYARLFLGPHIKTDHATPLKSS
jgi:NADH-quinone oxidoreductase subunit L